MTLYKYVDIEYANPVDFTDTVTLRFNLRPELISQKWASKVLEAQEKNYPIDDPARFYGFNDKQQEIADALYAINNCISIINSHGCIITRKLEAIDDFDTLNYLHHIFEVYHGLLDQQTHPFYTSASAAVQKAIADLNVLVHRCESIGTAAPPKHIVTYYGLPKTSLLSDDDYSSMTDVYTFGTIYLQYVEIGKTLEDLATDQDAYIADDAFRPLRHFSADFVVRFGDSEYSEVLCRRELYKKYFTEHSKFFIDKGFTYSSHIYLKPGKIPLADIDTQHQDVLELLKTRQYIKSVIIT